MSFIHGLLRPSYIVASGPRNRLRFTHSSGKRFPLLQRDWGVVGHLSRPRSLSGDPDEPDGEEGATKKARYQTDNYTPVSDPTPSHWAQHRASIKSKFPDGWAPPHKISRAAMDGLRALHAHDPDTFTTSALADKFRISPEAVRRILKGKWQPTQEQHARLLERERRHRQERVKSKSAAEGRPGTATEGKWKRSAGNQGQRRRFTAQDT